MGHWLIGDWLIGVRPLDGAAGPASPKTRRAVSQGRAAAWLGRAALAPGREMK